MNTKKTRNIALTLGITILVLVGLVWLFKYAMTVDFVQMPFEIKWKKPVVYRKETKEYRQNQVLENAERSLDEIDAFFRDYPEELPKATPTPTPTKGVESKVNVQEFSKYLTDQGAKNREIALAYIASKWTGDDVVAFDNILKKESGHRADVINEIGAGGICQAYPYTKMPCKISNDDLMCQLEWCNNYIVQRYGTPFQAWSFHLINNWF